VVIGRGRANAGFPGHGPERQRLSAFSLKYAPSGVYEGAGEVAVVVRADLSVSSFSHWPHRKTLSKRCKDHVDTVQIGAI
jgi:hypothetical protein